MELVINTDKGLITTAKFIASPNFDLRPKNTLIDMIVIHNISLPKGQFGNDEVINLFLNQSTILPDLKVSAHLFIRRNGEIIQFVPFHLRAWHAGVSHFEGKDNCNDFSIGIELEGTDTIPYEDRQYTQLVDVIDALQKIYPHITVLRIVGHSDVAPLRKTDPGLAFDWQKIKK